MMEVINVQSPVRTISVLKGTSASMKKKPEFASVDVLEMTSELREPVTPSRETEIAHFTELLHEEFNRGYNDARTEMEQEIRKRVESQISERVSRFEKMIGQLSKELVTLRERSEKMIPALAIAIAEKIIRKQISVSNDIIIAQVRDAVRRVVGVEKVRVRVNPADEIILREHRSALLQEVDSVQDIIIESDEKIEQGGCILESDMGNVDARLTTQLSQIEEAFRS